MSEDSAVNYWEVRYQRLGRFNTPILGETLTPRFPSSAPLTEIRPCGVRLQPESSPDVVRVALQAAAAVVRRNDPRTQGPAPSTKRGGLHQLLLLVHHPARPLRDPNTDRRELYQVLSAPPLLPRTPHIPSLRHLKDPSFGLTPAFRLKLQPRDKDRVSVLLPLTPMNSCRLPPSSLSRPSRPIVQCLVFRAFCCPPGRSIAPPIHAPNILLRFQC